MISRQMTEMELHPEMETERPAEATVIPAEDLAEEIRLAGEAIRQ